MSKVVIRDINDGALYIVSDKMWKYIDNFQKGIVTDEMRLALQDNLDDEFDDLVFEAYGTNGPNDKEILTACKYMARFVLPRP